MNIAIFGGTFDPIHRGHLAVARAARKKFHLERVYFVPAQLPPHKQRQPVTAFEHRYAMVALATKGETAFLPSLAEAGRREASYSIETVRRFAREMGKRDRLFFLIGIDAFLDVAQWRQPVELLQEAEFVVASRPGFSLKDVARALPEELQQAKRKGTADELGAGAVRIHLLDGVRSEVSATAIRATGRGSLRRLVPAGVAEYIEKMHLYGTGAGHEER